MKEVKDILAYPPGALHKTLDVARYLGRSIHAIRKMVGAETITPKIWTKTSMYFETSEILRWLEVSAHFKDNRGAPRHLEHRVKGPERERFADARIQDD